MKTTEANSLYDHLESESIETLLLGINSEDQKVALAVGKEIRAISSFVAALCKRMTKGGRLFYIGAGTSGRLGILDASECPPTFGVDDNVVIGIIAGGDIAIRKAVENAEDSVTGAWEDLLKHNPTSLDTVIGIAASGTTPYVIHGVKYARKNGLLTACITCNNNSVLAEHVEHPISVVVGPEFITGSTRMKSGTAQKMVLNMISTTAMIQLGKIQGNKMVDMQLSNDKLIARGTRMISEETGVDSTVAKEYLLKHGSVRTAINAIIDGAKD
ncbi:N-acetylmuramic acid 6-phosphate etherase [bacterium]|nr:N-acetylmuramic acid 6-phosphate etherase [bacterium]